MEHPFLHSVRPIYHIRIRKTPPDNFSISAVATIISFVRVMVYLPGSFQQFGFPVDVVRLEGA